MSIELKLTGMANGGAALGRDAGNRVIFTPYTIPDETVTVEIVQDKGRFANARLQEVIEPSPDRVEPSCPHFGVCGGCHWQHIAYDRQLQLKQSVVAEQLTRIGKISEPTVLSTLLNPHPYHNRHHLTLSRLAEGGVGLWSPVERQVVPIDTCHLVRPELVELLADLDIELPELRKITLRAGTDGERMVALAIEDVEPPQIEVDFPVSLALVLPDGVAANLIGDTTISYEIKGRNFQVSAGTFFYPSPPATEQLIDTVLAFANLTGTESVLELYSGAGTLTAFLAQNCAELTAIEANEDSVQDMASNLEDVDNVALFEGWVEEIMPALSLTPDLIIVDPPSGLAKDVMQPMLALQAPRLIYISQDVATLARDAKFLTVAGYQLTQVQPIDMEPQTFHVLTVSLWML